MHSPIQERRQSRERRLPSFVAAGVAIVTGGVLWTISAPRPSHDRASGSEISGLIQHLKSGDSHRCAKAAVGVGKLGPQGVAAIPDLIPLLGNTNPGDVGGIIVFTPVRQIAADALRRIGPKSLPAIVEAIRNHKASKVREGAVLAISGFDIDPKELLPTLDQALDDSNDRVRVVALQGIARHGKSAGNMVPHVAKLLRNDASVQVRIDAAYALRFLDPEGRSAVAELSGALADSAAAVRVVAARSLAEYGAEARPALPALIGLLTDKEQVPYAYSADHFGSRETRGEVAVVLGVIGAVAEPAVAALDRLRAEASAPFETRVNAAVAVIRILPQDEHAVNAFLDLLDEDELWSSDLLPVLDGLEITRGRAQRALPAIRRHLKKEDGSVCWEATRALVEAGGAAAVPDLVALLESDDYDAQAEAAQALGELGPDAKAAVPALLKVLDTALHEETDAAHLSALGALSKIGPPAKAALPRLRDLLGGAGAGGFWAEVLTEAIKKIAGE